MGLLRVFLRPMAIYRHRALFCGGCPFPLCAVGLGSFCRAVRCVGFLAGIGAYGRRAHVRSTAARDLGDGSLSSCVLWWGWGFCVLLPFCCFCGIMRLRRWRNGKREGCDLCG